MKKIISFFLALLICFSSMCIYAYAEDNELVSWDVKIEENYDYAWEVLRIVNEERAKVGAPPYTMDKNMLEGAMQRAAECAVHYSHERPDGSGPGAAENILVGGRNTPEFVMECWMNSPGHRANILNNPSETWNNFIDACGIGCVKVCGRYFWVQNFDYLPKSEYVPISQEEKNGIEFNSRTVNMKKEYLKLDGYCKNIRFMSYDIGKEINYGDVFSLYPICSDYDWGETMGYFTLGEDGYKENNDTKPDEYCSEFSKLSPDELIFTSQDENVVKVKENGNVQICGFGETTITVTLKKYDNVKCDINVIVTDYVPDKPAVKTVTGYNSIKLSWDKVDGADGYRIYQYNTKTKKYKGLANTTSTSYLIKNKAAGSDYYYLVRAYHFDTIRSSYAWNWLYQLYHYKNGNIDDMTTTVYSPYTVNDVVKCTTLSPSKPKVKKTAGTNSIKLSWNKVDGANGYRIYQYNTKTKKYIGLANTTSTSYLIKNKAAGSDYYYLVRAYNKTNAGVGYSAYSTKDNVKCTTLCKSPSVKVSGGKKEATLKWNKVSGAKFYRVYRWLPSQKKYVCVASSVKGTSFTQKNIGKGKKYYLVRAFNIENKGSAYSSKNIKSCYVK